ncbi:uncharacterized protein LOC142785234 [Rhipicephalus microplus]|uniref:uncharacterized protein LOC142785234 n=1 Tax=Rhipicephalus microplus TaxID=6941 RepID=UPI003F6BCD35
MQALLALLVSWLPVVSWCSDCSYALPQNVVGNSHYACVQLLGKPDNATFIDPDTWMELDLRFPAQSSATSSSPAHIYELPHPAGFSGHGSSANGVALTRVVFTMQWTIRLICPENHHQCLRFLHHQSKRQKDAEEMKMAADVA